MYAYYHGKTIPDTIVSLHLPKHLWSVFPDPTWNKFTVLLDLVVLSKYANKILEVRAKLWIIAQLRVHHFFSYFLYGWKNKRFAFPHNFVFLFPPLFTSLVQFNFFLHFEFIYLQLTLFKSAVKIITRYGES